MSQEKVVRARLENLRVVDFQSKNHINCIRLNPGNSPEHEFFKVVDAWLLLNGFDGGITKRLEEKILELAKELRQYSSFDRKWKSTKPIEFITEAKFREGKRRVDLFILDNGEVREYEKDYNIIKRKGKGDVKYRKIG